MTMEEACMVKREGGREEGWASSSAFAAPVGVVVDDDVAACAVCVARSALSHMMGIPSSFKV
jgi:hypothetical protein